MDLEGQVDGPTQGTDETNQRMYKGQSRALPSLTMKVVWTIKNNLITKFINSARQGLNILCLMSDK